jgi:uncharacterized protein (DUF1330 family)
MNRYVTVSLSMLAGAVIGGAAIETIHAQAKPPVYQVTLQEVSNNEALLKEFVPAARASIVKHGGKFIASGAPVALDGAIMKDRVVINQWESMEKAKEWFNLPEYQKAREVGNKYAKFTIVLVPGFSQ